MHRSKLIEFPKKGNLLIITDLHGNLKDYEAYMSIMNKRDDINHMLITGDFIHGAEKENSNSITILESIMRNCENFKNFHVLLGNHEWAHIVDGPVFKGGKNQRLDFEVILKENFGNEWTQKLEEYKSFFKSLPVAARTKNRLIITHAGPVRGITGIEDIIHIADSGNYNNVKLFEMVWNRPEDYSENDINQFLNAVECNFSIVGHTSVDGVKVINNKQIIISFSYTTGKKAYMEIDLSMELLNINELLNSVKYLNSH